MNNPSLSINEWSRKRLWRFLIIWGVGIAAFFIYRLDFITITIPSAALTVLRFSTYVILPRSILELGSSEELFGQSYFQGAILFEFTTATLSIMSLTWCVIEFVADKTSFTQLVAKDWWTAVMVSIVIVFRPALVYDTSIFSNIIDDGGLYFIREGVIIPICYYFLTKLILDYLLRKDFKRRQAEESHG